MVKAYPGQWDQHVWGPAHHMRPAGAKPLGALWGHEWVAVAWMASAIDGTGFTAKQVASWIESRDPYFNHVGPMK